MRRRPADAAGAVLVLGLWIVATLSLMLAAASAGVRYLQREQEWARLQSVGGCVLYAAACVCRERLTAHPEKPPPAWEWSSDEAAADFGDDARPMAEFRLLCRPSDECGRLNLNTAPAPVLREAARLVGADADAADVVQAILDWRDADDAGPFERDAYADVPGSVFRYGPPNAPFSRVEELAFVAGITPLLFWGEDGNHNGVLEPEEDDGEQYLPSDNADGQLQPGLAELVTVRGDGTLNVNGAREPVLRAALRAVLPEEQADPLAAGLLRTRMGRDGAENTEDDHLLTLDEAAGTLGAETVAALEEENLPLGVVSEYVAYDLVVEFPAVHAVMEARCVFQLDTAGVRLVEWRDGLT